MTLPRALAFWLALFTGLLLFVQYFVPWPWLSRLAHPFLLWIIVLTATAFILAAAQLVVRHARKVRTNAGSTLLLIGFILTLIAGLLPQGYEAGFGAWLYDWLLAPGLAALFALLPIFLAYALYKHLQLRSIGSLLLVVALLIVLLGQTPLIVERLPMLAALRHDILIAPVAIGFRALIILLAIGLVLNIWTRLRDIVT